MNKHLKYLEDLAHRLSYKPEHSFVVLQIDEDEDTVIVGLACKLLPNATYANAEDVGLTIKNTVKLKSIKSPADALHVFARVVADFELHEAAEFFQLDNSRIFMPHGWDNKTDDTGGMTWADFTNLSGRYLRAIKWFIKKNN